MPELELSTHTFEAIAKAAEDEPVMLWITRADGVALYVNKCWCTLTGQSFEESLGLGWRNVLHPDDASAGIAQWLHCVRTKQPNEDPLHYRMANGSYKFLFSHTFPVQNEHDEIVYWIGTAVEDRADAEAARTFFAQATSILLGAGHLHSAGELERRVNESVLVRGGRDDMQLPPE